MNSKFEVGTVIKGKDLKGYTLCKILSENMNIRGFQYKTGINVDVNPLALKGSCEAGLYFCFIEDICNYLAYGTKLAIVKVPEDEDVYVDRGKFRTHRLEIRKIMPYNEVATWRYLYKSGARLTGDNNYAVRWAAEKGHLEVVKYLHKSGANITADSNYAVRWAADNGHLKVVEYLHKNGANIVACDNYAVRMAASNGHLEVVKYLYENGADITAYDNYAVKKAEKKGHTDVAEYLRANLW